MEVPPDIEAKPIVSPFPTLFPHSFNPPLLKNDSTLLIFFHLLAGLLQIRFVMIRLISPKSEFYQFFGEGGKQEKVGGTILMGES